MYGVIPIANVGRARETVEGFLNKHTCTIHINFSVDLRDVDLARKCFSSSVELLYLFIFTPPRHIFFCLCKITWWKKVFDCGEIDSCQSGNTNQ